MHALSRLPPRTNKPHIALGRAGRWVCRWPQGYGAIRGFGDTPVEAYANMQARFTSWCANLRPPV